MFGKKPKPIEIDHEAIAKREQEQVAALEASLEFLKNAKPAEVVGENGEKREPTPADLARAQRFGRRMDYKTAVVKEGERPEKNTEAGDNTQTETGNAATESAAESTAASAETADTEALALTAADGAGTAVSETAAETAVTSENAAESTQTAAAADAAAAGNNALNEEAPAEAETAAAAEQTEAAAESNEAEETAAHAENAENSTAFEAQDTAPADATAKEAPAAAETAEATDGDAKESAGTQNADTEENRNMGMVAPTLSDGNEPEQIANPLPTPKKHVSKEMDFDIMPDAEHMHFDVVDMKGIDFFEIN